MDKKAIRFKPPPEAKAFVIFRVGLARTANGHGGTQTRMKAPALQDGSVPDIWPIAEFSTQKVLEMWGPGRYKAEFYDAEDTKMKGQGYLFDVAEPEGRTPRLDRKLRPARRPVLEDDSPSSPAAAAAGGIGFLELLTLLRGEREDADRRAEAAKERDREFYANQQSQQTQLLTALLGNRAGAIDPSMLGQQMNLAIQQGMLGIRQELFARQREEEDNEDPDPEPGDPPENLEQAGSRIGMAFFSEIERNAPHLLRELVPTVVEWLKPRGFQPSANLQQQIAATLRARNGAGHANGD